MSISDRRTFIKATIGGVAGLSLTGRAFGQTAPQGVASTSLGDNLTLLSGAGSNVLVLAGDDSTVLVDGGSAENANALMAAVTVVSKNTQGMTLLNTHWHPDVTGLNLRLGQGGATIIAHENTRLWLNQNVTWPWNGQRIAKLSKIAQPNKTFYTAGKLDSGIRYGYIADAAHTDGDMYVFFPKQNVLAVGGAVSGQGWPVVDWWSGGWIGGIVGGLQRLQTVANADTRIVAANGPVLKLEDLKTQYEMYGTIYDRLSQMMNKGRGSSEAVAAQPTKEFDAKMGNPDEFVRRSFESLWAYLSPDA